MARILRAARSHLALARSIQAADFSYNLPSSRIAKRPVRDRSSSRLLVAPGSHACAPFETVHARFHQLPDFLPRGCRLVLNTSRVIRARLHARKSTGGRAELLLLSPADGVDPGLALGQPLSDGVRWRCFIGGRRVRVGDVLQIDHASIPGSMSGVVLQKEGPMGIVNFEGNYPSLAEAIELFGRTPLPPYIHRDADAEDALDYQTVYAREAGSVAAPTAGLHITDQVLAALEERDISRSNLILHVGAGTFAQMGGDTAGEHDMHEEQFEISVHSLRDIAKDASMGRMIVAVGTTSVRTLESIYWHGEKLLRRNQNRVGGDGCDPQLEPIQDGVCRIGQWDPYITLDNSIDGGLPEAHDAFMAVADDAEHRGHCSVTGTTRLLIVPGYPFKVVGGLATNFHQPNSTLLMLVAAFCGSRKALLDIYHEALRKDYRFLSYGDSSLYFRSRGVD